MTDRLHLRAVVTGSATGVGLAIARRLAEDAASRGERAGLVLVDRDGPGLEAAVNRLSGTGARLEPVTVDLFREDSGEVVSLAARKLGGLDALISNAGVIGPSRPLVELGVAEYERHFAANTRATWLLVKALHPLLAASRGSVLAVASIAASAPAVLGGAYSASKAALVMIIRQLAFELGPDGIRCNSVSPGAINTRMNAFDNPDIAARRSADIPLRRIADPAEVAAVVAFLVGPDASYITGQDIAVDGGQQSTLLANAWKLAEHGPKGEATP
jgi:NAD(P)-dependent dehydrogenase (short-subunit alcohol dehydrogenase family)